MRFVNRRRLTRDGRVVDADGDDLVLPPREEEGRCPMHPDALQRRRLVGQPDAPESLWVCWRCVEIEKEKAERLRQRERDQDWIDYYALPDYGQRAQEALARYEERQAANGFVQPRSAEEYDAIERIDLGREDAIAKDNETSEERRKRHRKYWAKHYRVRA
jgi:hypothetical protein